MCVCMCVCVCVCVLADDARLAADHARSFYLESYVLLVYADAC